MTKVLGLSGAEAAARLAADGPNALPSAPPKPGWRRFLAQFGSPLVRILLVALAVDFGLWVVEGASTVPIESIAIAAILVMNAALGAWQENRSEEALARLSALAAPSAWVWRDGTAVRVSSRELVRGDVVRIESGDRVPADGTLLFAEGCSIDESILTGESVPVEKQPGDEAQSGTLLVRGRANVEISRIGAASTMGKIATMLGTLEIVETPLERRLDKLGQQIGIVVGALAVLLAVGGVLVEGLDHFQEVLVFAIALAVAAVPEGIAAVVTLTLALGVQRMADRKAVVRRLAAVEALGSVTVIATDKTGTLTENRMRVHAVDASDRGRALRAMVLCNDAEPEGAGDPLELGLLAHARSEGIDVEAMRAASPRASSRPFDSAWRFMRVTVEEDGAQVSYLKGAPEALLERSAEDGAERARWLAKADEAASAGHRVLALGRSAGAAEEGVEILGLVLLWDPPRPEVGAAIRTAQDAGIRVVMITGDHPGTARSIASAIGMARVEVRTGAEIDGLSAEAMREVVKEASVFSRVSPEHKLRLVEALRANGDLVAMTGDGVNDAPALKRADVGVSMGLRGSDVAREVSDVVLLDDNFATIVAAIEEGRGIYQNVQTFLRFTLSTNVALVILVVVGAVGAYAEGMRDASGLLLVPLTALQLLWINFLGDGPPALAVALDRNPGVMQRPPRPPSAPIFDRAALRFVGLAGVLKGLLGLSALVIGPLVGLSLAATQTFVFHYHSLGKLVTALPARRVGSRPLANPILAVSLVSGLALQVATVVWPTLGRALGVETLPELALVAIAGLVLFTWALGELAAWWASRGAAKIPGPTVGGSAGPPRKT